MINYVKHYNQVRFHSAIGYVTRHTKLAGREKEVFAARMRSLKWHENNDDRGEQRKDKALPESRVATMFERA